MRKFYLKNGHDEIYDLTNIKENAFMASPNGLGLNRSLAYARLGNSRLKVGDLREFKTITGELYFKNTQNNNGIAYSEYQKFINFLDGNALELHCELPNDTKFFRKVSISDLTKTEVDVEFGTLMCSITLEPEEFWKSKSLYGVELSDTGIDVGKAYELQRPYSYLLKNVDQVEINNPSNMSIPFYIKITGYALDPQWNVFNSNNVLTSVCQILGEYDVVEVNSDDLLENITLIRNGTQIPMPYNYQNLNVGQDTNAIVTFCKLPPGKNLITFNFGNAFDGVINIEWRLLYESV